MRVQLLIRGPGVAKGRTLPHLVLNSDLAPTFAQMAGIIAPSFVDGRSLMPLLGSTPLPEAAWRQAIRLEHGSGVVTSGLIGRMLAEREDEPPDLEPTQVAAAAINTPPHFVGLRTARYKYLESSSTGECELFDLIA